MDDYVLHEIKQILDTQTIERTKYYINRLIKRLTEIRTNKINDINLNRWKEYNDIITDSLWVANTLQDFLDKMEKLIEKISLVLEKNRYLALIISDKYENGEWISLGFYTMQQVLKHNYTLKSTVVKNFEETKAKVNQKELWRYRALVGGFYVFKHEYIFIFKKD